MFDIKLVFDDINISSVEREDLKDIYSLILSQEKCLDNNMRIIKFNEFYDNFLEYYLGECEFFLKIVKNNILIGMFRGRVEFKNPNEVWFKYLLLKEGYRNFGTGSKVLNNIIEYFKEDCSIDNYYCILDYEDCSCINFYKKNKFFIYNFFNTLGKKNIVLKKF